MTPRARPEQCEGCTWVTTQVGELSYLHSRDITYAVFGQGPYDESARYRDFMGWDMPWYSAHASLDALLTGRHIGLFHLVCYLRDGGHPARRHTPAQNQDPLPGAAAIPEQRPVCVNHQGLES